MLVVFYHSVIPGLGLNIVAGILFTAFFCSAGKKEDYQGTVYHNEQRNQRQQRFASRVSGVYL